MKMPWGVCIHIYCHCTFKLEWHMANMENIKKNTTAYPYKGKYNPIVQ